MSERDTILTAKQEAARCVTEMRRIHEAAEAENRSKTAEERAEFDRLAAAHSEFSQRVSDAEAVREASQAEARYHNTLDGSVLGQSREERESAEGLRAYTAAFEQYIRRGVSGMNAEQRNILAAGQVESRTDFTAGTTTTGGYTVPSPMVDRIFQQKLQAGAVRKTRVSTFKTSHGQPLLVPIDTTLGAAEWLGEGTGAAKVADTFGQISLGAYASVRQSLVSVQLLQDSAFDIQAFIADSIGQKVARKQNDAYVFGTGTTQPLGMSLTGSIAASVAGVNPGELEVAAAAGPTADEAIQWYFTLGAQYRDNAEIIAHDSLIRVLMQLKSTTGQYLWASSLQDGTPNKFMNLPVYNEPALDATGTDEHVVGILADFANFYAIRDVNEFNVSVLRERYADSLQVGIVGWQRTDGHIIDAAAGVQLACGAA